VIVLGGLDAVRGAVGRDLGTSDWVTVTAAQVGQYAQATGDSSPDGATVSPWFVLSLTNLFIPQIVEVRGIAAGVNYGTGEVRFLGEAQVGERLRGAASLIDATEVSGGVQTTIRITVEVEGIDEPVCVIDSLSRWLE